MPCCPEIEACPRHAIQITGCDRFLKIIDMPPRGAFCFRFTLNYFHIVLFAMMPFCFCRLRYFV